VWKSGVWNASTWYWNFGDGTTSTIQNPTHTYSSAGNYNVKLVVGCPKDSVSKTIAVTGACSITVTAAALNICSGGCTTVTSTGSGGTGLYTYSWNTGATAQSISACPISTTTYTVKITDAGGATATTTSTVTVNPAVTVTTTGTTPCNGINSSIIAAVAGGSSSFTYSWSNGLTAITNSLTSQISNLTSGSYSVTVTDVNGCTATVSAFIYPPLTALYIKGTANCADCGCKEWVMLTASGGTQPYSYLWPSGYDKRYQNELCPGPYTINITDTNGCSVKVVVSAP